MRNMVVTRLFKSGKNKSPLLLFDKYKAILSIRRKKKNILMWYISLNIYTFRILPFPAMISLLVHSPLLLFYTCFDHFFVVLCLSYVQCCQIEYFFLVKSGRVSIIWQFVFARAILFYIGTRLQGLLVYLLVNSVLKIIVHLQI